MLKFIASILGRVTQIFSGRGLRKRYAVLNKAYRWLRGSLSPQTAMVNGHKMNLDDQDSMNLAASGVYEPYQTSLIKRWVKPGFTVLDIGANIGYYTLLFANLVGNNGKVFAFEPEPYTFTLLAENVAQNGYSNIVLMEKAVSDHDGNLVLFTDQFSNLDHRIYGASNNNREVVGVGVVRLDSLDELINSRVDLIKMDIQGAECSALKGMTTLLANNADIILLTEFWPAGLKEFGTSSREIFELLQELDFDIFEMDETNEQLARVNTLESLLVTCAKKPFYTNLACAKGQSAQQLSKSVKQSAEEHYAR